MTATLARDTPNDAVHSRIARSKRSAPLACAIGGWPLAPEICMAQTSVVTGTAAALPKSVISSRRFIWPGSDLVLVRPKLTHHALPVCQPGSRSERGFFAVLLR